MQKDKKRISAEIIADSINIQGDRIVTYLLTYPRFIHSELLTHRMFSRNAASSRAVPAKTMIYNVDSDPFIPISWQKEHKGMQGTEYFESEEEIEYLKDIWLEGKEQAVTTALSMLAFKTTKQIINRILEPYMWYTCIVTATEYDNFFNLRTPIYLIEDPNNIYRSKKQVLKDFPKLISNNEMDWRKLNHGGGEIHIMELAECMWDANRESEPKFLRPGEWHIPFGETFDSNRVLWKCINDHKKAFPDEDPVNDLHNWDIGGMMAKIAVARCARVSYLNFEGKDDYDADIKLYNRLKDMKHMSPFEHVAKAMGIHEYSNYKNGNIKVESNVGDWTNIQNGMMDPKKLGADPMLGWCRNFKGFIQERALIEDE